MNLKKIQIFFALVHNQTVFLELVIQGSTG